MVWRDGTIRDLLVETKASDGAIIAAFYRDLFIGGLLIPPSYAGKLRRSSVYQYDVRFLSWCGGMSSLSLYPQQNTPFDLPCDEVPLCQLPGRRSIWRREGEGEGDPCFLSTLTPTPLTSASVIFLLHLSPSPFSFSVSLSFPYSPALLFPPLLCAPL